MLKKKLLLIILIITFQQSLLAETVKVFDFTELEFETLKVKKVRGAKNVGAWASGGNLNSAKEAGASSKNGTQTAYLAISGRTPPNSVNDFVELFFFRL